MSRKATTDGLERLATAGDAFVRIRQNQVVLPNKAQCKKCGFFDVTNPEVVALLREAGRELWEARCTCSDAGEERRRADVDRWADSNMPNRGANGKPRTFDNFLEEHKDKDHTNRYGMKAAKELADNLGEQQFLVLIGDTGTGKSHLLEAIGRTWLHNGKSVRYEFVPALLDELRAGNKDLEGKSVHTLMQWRHNFQLLILDDLGKGNASDWTAEKLNELVDYRIRNGGALVLATNKLKEQIAAWADEPLAGRLWNQDGTVKVVHLTSGDFRSRKKTRG